MGQTMVNKEDAKQKIKGLLEKYDKVVEEKKFSKYTEADTKAEFIEPLFEALGWDVRNRDEVTREETISKGRVDYGFRINGIPKFFLEAKALKADLDDPEFAEQAINYAWHKGCTWAVLTDFDQGVKIFNAEWKTTDPSQSRPITISRQEFLDRFEELWLLSKEGFEQGLLDKEAVKWGKKTKKTPVSEQLLNDLTTWRAKLSKDILERNKDKRLTEEELDEAVQRIIDRLIFIRNCEDRELEPPKLLSAMREWKSKRKGTLAERIIDVFNHFDVEYNGKLFRRHLCDDLDVSNQVLEEIINGLDHTKDKTIKYDFSALDADVLGNVYEQYLGYILKKTAKRAVLKEKYARRKEQGIYYTPTYIVDYIVRNTLGELLKDKKVDVEKIRVLDPACGSGSFLIKALDILNEFHSKTDKDYGQTQLDLEMGLPFTKKVKILQNNIFGVDLDTKAVEIAQLSLLLRITEKRRRLPLLRQNVKCGNSLIDDKKVAGNKAFKWEQEFKQIMDEGGFDVVIGNPPYGAKLNDKERKFLLNNYPATKNNTDTAIAFINRAYNLLKKNGYLGLIVPKPLIYSQKWAACREFIRNDLVSVVDVSKAFKDVLLEQIIIIIKKNSNQKKYLIDFIDSKQKPIEVEKSLIDKFGNLINDVSDEELALAIKINTGNYISDVATIKRGLIIQHFLKKEGGEIPVLRGKSIGRYLIKEIKEYVTKGDFKKIETKANYLLQPKIVIQNIVAHITKPRDHIIIMATIDEKRLLALDNVGCIFVKGDKIDKLFLVALLNSKLMSWYAYRFIYAKAIRTMRLDKYHISKMPLCDYKGKPEYKKVIAHARKIFSLNKRLNEIGDKKTDERMRIEEEIKKTDAEIDKLVYKLYVTEPEEKIIEESLR